MTLIREINEFGIKDKNGEYKIDGRYLMFLDTKFIRGIFWELDILSGYKGYCDICIAIRELLLLSYKLYNEGDAYKLIRNICSGLLCTFIRIINEI